MTNEIGAVCMELSPRAGHTSRPDRTSATWEPLSCWPRCMITAAWMRTVHKDAERFLYPQTQEWQDHYDWAVSLADGLNPAWLRDSLDRSRR